MSSGNESPAGASARFPRFDGIGGIAAVMVIIYHAVFFTTWFGNAAASLAIPIVLRVRPFHHINVFQDVGVNVFSTFIGASVVVPAVLGPQDEGRIRRLLRSRVLTFLGLVSYGLYLWHWFLLQIVQIDWLGWPFRHGNPIGVCVVAFPLILGAATASWYLLERPILHRARWAAERFASRRTVRRPL